MKRWQYDQPFQRIRGRRRPRALLLAAACCAITVGERPSARNAPAEPGPSAAMQLGVQTHFSQGWPLSYLDLLRASGARSIRDGAPWAENEKTPGRYDLAGPHFTALERFCKTGGTLVLTVAPLNPLYDGGGALHSLDSMAAYAKYLVALADHFGPCLTALEIGNEINTHTPQILQNPPPGVSPLQAYVQTVATVRRAFLRHNPRVQILGGSTNVIATGFLEKLFAAGLLDAADGIVVHPYRAQAEGVDFELSHLDELMRRHGKVLPIWATEFSDNFANPERAAPHLIKMIAMMSATGLHEASWYALVDQKWFHNMGLYSEAGAPKPAQDAFRLALKDLLTRGPAIRVTTQDPNARIYRFGADAWVAWGASGRIQFPAGARLLDPRGNPITRSRIDLSEDPVIALGAEGFDLQPGTVLADSLLEYGSSPWSYHARRTDGAEIPLSLVDWTWSPRFTAPSLSPLFVEPGAAAPQGTSTRGTAVIIRYTSPREQNVTAQACLAKQPGGDGVEARIGKGPQVLASAVIDGAAKRLLTSAVHLDAGETIDFIIGAHGGNKNNKFSYRLRILASAAPPDIPCPGESQEKSAAPAS